MDPTSEIPEGEKTVVPPELGAKMAEATSAIEQNMAEPGADIAAATGQMSMMAEFWKLGKETGVKRLGVLFKDAKAILGIIPFAPMIGKKLGMEPYSGLTKGAQEVGAMGNEALAVKNQLAAAEKRVADIDKKLGKTTNSERLAKLSTDRAAAIQTRDAVKHKYLYANADWAAKAQVYKEKIQTTGIQPENFDNPRDRMKRGISKTLSIPLSDEQMMGRWNQVNAHADTFPSKGKPEVTLKERVQWLGNGDMPALTKGEAFGRRAKFVAKRLVLEQLGPIINPVPDVPGLVTLASYGSELLGFVWGGLIPPVWQYVHNRYENAKLMVESSQKAMEIVKRHRDQKFNKLKEPQVARAAAMFA